MQSGNISLYKWTLGLFLAVPLYAAPVLDGTPQPAENNPLWPDDIAMELISMRCSLPYSQHEQDSVFAKQRWPSIVQGAVWSKRQGKTPMPVRADTLIPLLKQAFSEEGIPQQLAWLAEVESTLDPAAVSRSGATGLFQFKREAAARFDLIHANADHRSVPDKSARAAARYLAHLYSRLGDWTLAIAGYNAGEGCVERLMKQHKATSYEAIAPHLPPQTQVYVIKVMTILTQRENITLSALPSPRS